ncbi:unnamed protein product [Somion occarium]|uniref:Uncharacterized protein n=1 Tax=Somion occarium TaxID=3059160 RepID=A0ABP1CH25_9APHY
MGCIPSKQSVLDDDFSPSCFGLTSKRSPQEEKSRPNKPKGPPSPIVEGSLPPWLQKRAVLTQRADGNIVIMEHNPQKLS